ncbi:MAG TPA: hypothetical protein VGR65_08675 [Casimicrobiaceae bacterium]|nr:hypothetical protein [Casimicrobiaceae bacterium]
MGGVRSGIARRFDRDPIRPRQLDKVKTVISLRGDTMRLQITAQALQVIRHASSLLAYMRDFGRDIAVLVKLEAKLAMASIVSIALLSVAVLLLLFTG